MKLAERRHLIFYSNESPVASDVFQANEILKEISTALELEETLPSDRRGLADTDAILPSQYFEVDGEYDNPEGRLAVAVLQDAVACLELRGKQARTSPNLLAVCAREWFESDDTSWPYSFLNVCSYLDLDGSWFRAELELRAQRIAAEPYRPVRKVNLARRAGKTVKKLSARKPSRRISKR